MSSPGRNRSLRDVVLPDKELKVALKSRICRVAWWCDCRTSRRILETRICSVPFVPNWERSSMVENEG
jgi:hypothetical protein